MSTKTTKKPGRVLPDLATQAKLIKELEAKLAAAEAKVAKATIKVSSKGGVSVYGLGRFPVTLYLSQWEKLFSMIPDVQEFIKKNESKLAVKE